MEHIPNHLKLISGLQFLSFQGAEIALDYQCETEQPTHLLVLVNGFQRNRLDYRAFRKKWAKIAPHVATVAFDNRYCGETNVNAEALFSLETMVQDTHAVASVFMEKLNLKTFSLLGISMGGMIAQTLASLLPYGTLDNLFLVSTTCGGIGRTWSKPVENPSALKYENKNVDLESTKKNMSYFFAEKFLKNSPLLFEMMCKSMLISKEKGDKNNNTDKAASKQFSVSVTFDRAQFLNQISAKKTCIFSGDEDKIIPYANSLYLNQHIPGSTLITYKDVGHLILIEEPEQFVQDVGSYFL